MKQLAQHHARIAVLKPAEKTGKVRWREKKTLLYDPCGGYESRRLPHWQDKKWLNKT